MGQRRKRIPYDPPSARKRKRRGGPPRRADQMFLTRRMFMLKGTLVGAFGVLAARLGYMQLVKGEHYTEESRDYTVRSLKVKAPRGLIFDRNGLRVADNHRSWTVLVNPDNLPEDPVDFARVRETIITALRLPDALVIDPGAVPTGGERTVYARVASLLGDDDLAGWVDYITTQSNYNRLVLCEKDLTADQAATFRAAAAELPGVQVMNIFDYRIRNNTWGSSTVVIKRDVSEEIALKLEANRLYLPGVTLDDTTLARGYPGGEVMSHLLGYVGTIAPEEYEDPAHRTAGGNKIYDQDDLIGKDGLERTMEALLRGQKGIRWVEVDALENVQSAIPGKERLAEPGKNLKLATDLELQAAISDILKNGLLFSNADRKARDEQENRKTRKYSASSGAVVVIDVRNGHVLGCVSFPHYDNRLFLDGISERKYNEYLDPKRNKPLVNRAVADNYPPGSTIKPFIAAAAMKEKVIDEGTSFTCSGAIRVPWTWDESKGTDYPCWNKSPGHGTLSVADAIARSCDVWFYNVGAPKQKPEGAAEDLHYYDLNWNSKQIGDIHYFVGLGISKMNKNLKDRFWFGEATGIDLPWEAPGLVPNPDWLFKNYQQYWSSGDTINASIGQGYFLATPLQLCLNTAAVANGGKVFRPLLVKEICDDQGNPIQTFEPQLLRTTHINREYFDVIREGMRRVVHEPTGTAHHNLDQSSKWAMVNPEGEDQILIGGKTGTAEFGKQAEDGTYEHQHAWFTAFAPYDDPEIAITVFLEDGGEGSSYAVPVADRVMRAYFESEGRRTRGMVLREDRKLISSENPSPPASDFPGLGTSGAVGDD